MTPTSPIAHLGAACLASAVLTSAANAQALHNSDIILGLSDQNAIAFATAEDATNGVFAQQVFVGLLDANATADDPGFDSFSGTLPASTVLGYNILGPLRAWNGTAFPETPAPETMSVFKFGIERVTPSTTGTIVTGTAFGQADNGGRFHHHLDFELNPAPSQSVPAHGVYLLTLELASLNQASVLSSDPVYLVWDFGADDTIVANARDWAIANLTQTQCIADWDTNGSVNILDVVSFINTWNTQAQGADFNNDGAINVLDVIGFINVFNTGCP